VFHSSKSTADKRATFYCLSFICLLFLAFGILYDFKKKKKKTFAIKAKLDLSCILDQTLRYFSVLITDTIIKQYFSISSKPH
jgi:hypothetical protein